MLSERDALLFKLALERGLLDGPSYAALREELAAPGEVSAPRLLRARGVPGKEVGLLVELATPAADDPRAILSRADAEQVLVLESLRKAGLVPEARLREAEAQVREEARRGRFLAPSELLVEMGALELPRAAALRKRARELLATCPRCWRHYLLPARRKGRCPPCGETVLAGEGLSAVDAWNAAESGPDTTRVFAVTLAPPPAPVVAAPAREREDPSSRTAFDAHDEEAPASDPAAATVSDAEDGSGEHAARIDALLADWDASVAIAEEELASAPRTTYFGGYEVLAELARGGMGVVYHARRQGGGQEVALKVLLGGAQATARRGARFEREAELARKLSHPGVPAFVEAGIEEGFRFLAVELVPGQDLEVLVRAAGPLPWKEAVRIGARVAATLEYVHGEGVVHRDLKPDNVILRPDGQPVLIDFGLARILEGRQLTEESSTLGTPSYMPPEQVTGKSSEAGPAADVYALAAILQFLITGQPPFTEQEPAALYHRIVTAPPPPLRSLVSGVPAALEALILRALAKDPQERPSVPAFLAALERVGDDPAPSAPPAPPSAAPSASTSRALQGAALLAVLAVGALVALLLWRWSGS